MHGFRTINAWIPHLAVLSGFLGEFVFSFPSPPCCAVRAVDLSVSSLQCMGMSVAQATLPFKRLTLPIWIRHPPFTMIMSAYTSIRL